MKTALNFILGIVLLMFASHTGSAQMQQITLFGNPLTLAAPLDVYEHDTNFLQLLNLDQVHVVASLNTTNSDMNSIFSVLMQSTPGPAPTGTPVRLLIYSTVPDASTNVPSSLTHAFSVFMLNQAQMTQFYYEKVGTHFSEVPSLRAQIDGNIDYDVVRAIHFAAIGNNGFPQQSTMYVFEGTLANQIAFTNTQHSLTEVFAADHFRQWGFDTAGLRGDTLYAFYSLPIAASHCGNINECDEGINKCSVGGECDGDNQDTCTATEAANAAETQDINLGVNFNFSLMRNFRDTFLRKCAQGRDYIGFYYAFGGFVKLDPASLVQYANVLPPLYTAMNALMTNSGNPVIVTSDLQTNAQAIIDNHRDVSNPFFQNILNRLESDLDYYAGMNRSNLLATLTLSPLAQAPTLSSAVIEGGGVRVFWQGTVGQTNVLQAATNLFGGGKFVDISPAITLQGSITAVTNYLDAGALTNSPARFYRVRQ